MQRNPYTDRTDNERSYAEHAEAWWQTYQRRLITREEYGLAIDSLRERFGIDRFTNREIGR